MFKSNYESLQEKYFELKAKCFKLELKLEELKKIIIKQRLDEVIKPCISVLFGSDLALAGYTGLFIFDSVLENDKLTALIFVKLGFILAANVFFYYSLYRAVRYVIVRR